MDAPVSYWHWRIHSCRVDIYFSKSVQLSLDNFQDQLNRISNSLQADVISTQAGNVWGKAIDTGWYPLSPHTFNPVCAELSWAKIEMYAYNYRHRDGASSWNPSFWKTRTCLSHGCWCPGDRRGQGISSHRIDQVFFQYSSLSTR